MAESLNLEDVQDPPLATTAAAESQEDIPSTNNDLPIASTSKQVTQYRVGDHVYVGAPFSQREGGSPFMVCRIIALHPAKRSGEVSKVQVAYYLRRRDVTHRNLADFRVIFATFMTGIVPLSHVRSKCQVMFRDYLEDPEAFKRQDDCFVFFQLYDRFMHKPFDLIPTSQIMNAPEDTLLYMRSNYEFACTEMGSANDLCDATRSCASCHAFAAKDESVSCSTCSKTWHLGCLDPPLLRKPALGWRWNCIKCNMAAEEEDDSDAENSVIVEGSSRTASRAEAAAAAAAKRKGAGPYAPSLRKGKARIAAPVQGEQDVSKWKMKDGWPYRYFGQHVRFETISDPHDSIYPRASTRIGTRFQALGIPGEPEETHVKKRPPPVKKGKHSRVPKEAPSIQKERGDDEACEVIWTNARSQYTDSELDEYLVSAKDLPINGKNGNVDMMVYALQVLEKSSSTSEALDRLKGEGPIDLAKFPSMATWTQTEVNTFERNIINWEDELSEFQHNLSKKTLPQIVHYYYREKGPSRQHLHYEDPLARDKYGAVEPSGIEGEQGEEERGGEAEMEDERDEAAVEETSIAGTPPPSTRRQKRACAVCHTEQAEVWYKCPDGVGELSFVKKQKTMCPSCAVQWRHYGNPTPALTPEELDARDSRDGKKKIKKAAPLAAVSVTRSASPAMSDSPVSRGGSASPPPTAKNSNNPFKPCVMCKRPEPKATNYRCTGCGITVHTQCYGIPDNASKSGWLCDVCNSEANEEEKDSKKPVCSLCPPATTSSDTKTALGAFKRTSNDGWAHLFCGVWHHELAFRDTTLLDVIEGMEDIESFKLDKTCSVCQSTGTGACLQCECCPKWFHASCAWQAAYRFCFEVMPVKESRIEDIPTVQFKAEEGDMRPLVICKDHHWLLPRLFYDLGQKDKATGWSAILTYTHAYKSIDTKTDFPLLKRARMSENANQNDKQTPAAAGTPPKFDRDAFEDIYEVKAPFIRKPRKKRGKAGAAAVEEEAIEQEEPAAIQVLPAVVVKALRSSAPSITEPESDAIAATEVASTTSANIINGDSRQASPSLAPSKLAAQPKKRKRASKKQVSDIEDDVANSEDEVMPTASTSRARKTARVSIRSVSKADILESENPTVPPVPKVRKPKPHAKANGESVPFAPAQREIHTAQQNPPSIRAAQPAAASAQPASASSQHAGSTSTGLAATISHSPQIHQPAPAKSTSTPPSVHQVPPTVSPSRLPYAGWQLPISASTTTANSRISPINLAPIQQRPINKSPPSHAFRGSPIGYPTISSYSPTAYYSMAGNGLPIYSHDSRPGYPSQSYPYVVRKASDLWSTQNSSQADPPAPIPSPASSVPPSSSTSSNYYSFANLNRQFAPPPPIVSERRTSLQSMQPTNTTPFIPDGRSQPSSVPSPQHQMLQ